MKRRFVNALVFASLAGMAACGGGTATSAPAAPAPAPAPAAPPAASGPLSVYDGVYTAAQATRGEQVVQRDCSSCHTPQDWAQGRLLGGWQNQPASALIQYLQGAMPMDSPGRLSLQQYTDVFAFMLQLNNIPAGSTELAADNNAQRNVRIEYRR
ncbi:MAG: cytochrome c [Gemmatimonadota bacterium]|nr:cytochrome c [Gemmatimonadota bacterium]